MTPAETRYIVKAVDRELEGETKLRITLAKVAGGGVKLTGG